VNIPLKVLKWLDKNFENLICSSLLCAITVIMFYYVIMRYIFGRGIVWADEVTRYMLVAAVFVASGFSIRHGAVFRMTSIIDRFSPPLRFGCELLTDLLMIAFFLYLTYYGFGVSSFYRGNGMGSTTLNLPLWIVFCFIALCFALSAFRSAQKLLLDIKAGPAQFARQSGQGEEEYLNTKEVQDALSESGSRTAPDSADRREERGNQA